MPKFLKALKGRALALSLLSAALLGPVTTASPAYAAVALDAEEAALCTMINNYRATNGLGALMVSPTLTNAAEWYSNDMASKNYWYSNHTDSLGRDPFKRMADFGYTFNTYKGENIAAGYAAAADTFNQWKNSPGHNANMLNANYKAIGIGKGSNTASTYRHYWTNDFGGVVDSGSVPCPGSTTPPPPPTGPAIAVSDVTTYEGTSLYGGTKAMQFRVTIPAAATTQVKVGYSTANGTAIAGSDYYSVSGQVTIPVGARSATVSVPIVRDRIREANETVRLNIFSPVNGTIADSSGVGTILNDD